MDFEKYQLLMLQKQSHAIIPDVVEKDYADNGARREGVFYSLWTFGSKLGQALALGLSGLVLQLAGYNPEAVADAGVRNAIRLLCGPLALVFIVAGNLVLRHYPLDREAYGQVRLRIEDREKAST